MYGWINGCLEDLILEVFGDSVWDEIKKEADFVLPTGDFFRSVNYDDDSTYRLVGAACSVLGKSADEILESFGHHFIRYLEQNGYENTVKSQGNSLREWIKNVNEPHRLLRSRFPNSNLPEFWTENDDEDASGESILLHYYSTRGNRFLMVVVGIIKEAAQRYFQKDAKMQLIFAENVHSSSNVNFHAIWRIENAGKELSAIELSNFCTPPQEDAKVMHDKLRAVSENGSNLPMKCPFHAGGKRVENREASSQNTSINQSVSGIPDVPLEPMDIGLSGMDFRRIFPCHVIVDRDMNICQIGNTLLCLSRSKGLNILNRQIKDIFTLSLPEDITFSWQSLRKLRDANIEMLATGLNGVSPRSSIDLKFRGEVVFLNKGGIPSGEHQFAAFLISPCVATVHDLMQLDLSLNDLPKHSFQRDVLLIGEHLRSETDQGIKLTHLSKRLDHESKKAKDALKMKRIFVRYVSHEIRTPLNVSILGLKCLEDELHEEMTTHGLPMSGNVQEILDDVKISCTVAVEILNDLLLYEKMDDGIFNIVTAVMPIRTIIDEAEYLFRMQARAANVDFLLDASSSTLNEAVVDIDKGKLHQVLRNLVSNAIKFTPAGGEVKLSCEILQEEQTLPMSTQSTTNKGLPLLYPSDRRRISRSNSLSSIGSSDMSQTGGSDGSGKAATIHFAANVDNGVLGFDNASHRHTDASNSVCTSSMTTTKSASLLLAPPSSSPLFLPLSTGAGTAAGTAIVSSRASSSGIYPEVVATEERKTARKRSRREEEEREAMDERGESSEDGEDEENGQVTHIGVSEAINEAQHEHQQLQPGILVRKFVRISVQDTGPGISLRDQAQLFHEFIQVKADKLQNGQGSGLGLWIAANIMKMHGGRIGVMSEGEGKGSTFLIDIPLAELLPPPPPPPTILTSSSSSCSPLIATTKVPAAVGITANVSSLTSAGVLTTGNLSNDVLLSSPHDAKRRRINEDVSMQRSNRQEHMEEGDHRILDINESIFSSVIKNHESSALLKLKDFSSVPVLISSQTRMGTPTILQESAVHIASSNVGSVSHEGAEKLPLKETNVLIVDDVSSNRKVVRRLLRGRFGFIDDAENGQVAVNKVRDSLNSPRPFHLILMDFMMPVMNGLEATECIRKICRELNPLAKIVVIGVTGNSLESDIDAFRSAGADGVMLKPLDYAIFLQHLRKHGFDANI